MREALRAEGWSEAFIDYQLLLRRRAADQARAARRRLKEQEAELDQAYAVGAGDTTPWEAPDDHEYIPTRTDPLQVGSARVTEITARAASRRKAMTLHEHRRAVGS
jgi:nitrous oxide reductase accessory protein NosL